MYRLAIALAIVLSPTFSNAADELISGKVHVVKSAKLAKIVSKAKQQPAETPFTLPTAGGADDPTLVGASVTFADLGLAGGSVAYSLDASGWSALGNPPGSKGYKYKGRDDVVDSDPKGTCRVVLLKGTVIKAVCKGTAVTLTTPYAGVASIVLSSGTQRYCAEFGGSDLKNTSKILKRKDAPVATACPASGCTGYSLVSACWFSGAAGESCDTVCSNQGLTYDEATRTVAGSDGTDTNCEDLVNHFDPSTSGFVGTSNQGGLGCNYFDAYIGRRDVDPTTSSASDGSWRRICACQ